MLQYGTRRDKFDLLGFLFSIPGFHKEGSYLQLWYLVIMSRSRAIRLGLLHRVRDLRGS